MTLPKVTGAILLGLLLLLHTGCRPKDPADWRVSAKTPTDFSIWQHDNLKDLPNDLLREYQLATKNLIDYTPKSVSKNWEDQRNPVCNLIHKVTIRQVVFLGYDIHCDAINNEANKIYARMLETMSRISNAPAGADTRPAEQGIESMRQQIKYWDDQLKLVEKLKAEFRQRYPAKK